MVQTRRNSAGSTKNMVLAAFFLALGLVLPFLTGQIQGIGNKLLPMHFPVMVCGFVCGWQWGLAVGFVVPLLRSALWGMPVMMPMAVAMAFELAAYGAATGLLYRMFPKKNTSVYISLIGAMIVGRLVWGLVCVPLYGVAGKAFSVPMFVGGAFLNAIPGIVLQILLVPPVVLSLMRANVME